MMKRKISPAQAAQVLGALEREIPNMDERAFIAGAVIATLCSGGHDLEAWQMIDGKRGRLRQHELETWFINNKLPIADVAGLFRELTDAEDRNAALRFMFTFRRGDILDFEPDKLELRSEQERKTFGDSMVGMVANQRIASDQGGVKALLERAASLASGGSIPIASCARIFAAADGGSGFDQWDIVRKTKDSLLTRDFEELMKPVAANLVAADADKAMALLTSDPSTRYSYNVLNAGMKKYGSSAGFVWMLGRFGALRARSSPPSSGRAA